MLIFLICILRIYLPELCFHHIEVTKSFLFLFLLQLLYFFLLLKLFLIKLFFSQPGNNLHFFLIILAFSVSHFSFHSFVLFCFLRKNLKFLLQLFQVKFRIILSQFFHRLLLFLFFTLFLTSFFHCLFLINLHSLKLQFFGRQFMIGYIDQREFFLLRLIGDKTEFNF